MLNSTKSTTDAGAGISAGPVHCIENHDGALAIWRDAGVARRLLIHVDAHHDLYGRWVDKKNPKERAPINIANFLYAALEGELVREVIWVVPSATWATSTGRRDIVRELKGLDQGARGRKPAIQIEHDRIIGMVLGKRILTCTVETLPMLNETVLLDIDVDYFVIPNVGYRGIATYGSLPWCWPDELLAKLQARGVHADLTTIAYSVEGDYTPLQWKYLGDELAQRLQSAPPDTAWADHMREAAQAAGRGDPGSAEAHYEAARTLRPKCAAPRYHLAHLCAATGRLQAGREHLREAHELDPSYRTPYNSAGWWYLERRHHDQARAAFARTLSLDPGDAYAHLGCGLLAIENEQWSAAEASLRQAIALNDRCVEAYRALGRVLGLRGAHAHALAAYERSLQLALSGHRALTNPITLGERHDWNSPWDPDHGVVLAELARIHVKSGAWAKAITDYRMAIAAGGVDAASAWANLAALYARLGRWRDCAHATSQAAMRVPRSLIRWLQRVQARCQDRFDAWREASRPTIPRHATPQTWL